MSVKALGIALKLTLSGTNQLIYPQTWAFTLIVIVCVLTQMNYLNKVCPPYILIFFLCSSNIFAICLMNLCSMFFQLICSLLNTFVVACFILNRRINLNNQLSDYFNSVK